MFESELKVMEIIWDNDPEILTAKQISVIAADKIGWNKNTTYTIITKLVEKGIIEREEPCFQCIPLVSREQAQKDEVKRVVGRYFDGSRKAMLSALLESEKISAKELKELRELIDKK